MDQIVYNFNDLVVSDVLLNLYRSLHFMNSNQEHITKTQICVYAFWSRKLESLIKAISKK